MSLIASGMGGRHRRLAFASRDRRRVLLLPRDDDRRDRPTPALVAPPRCYNRCGMSRSEVDGLNAGYAALLLEQYLDNPGAVPSEWRALFETAPEEELLALQPGLALLFERLERNGGNGHAAPVASPSRLSRPLSPRLHRYRLPRGAPGRREARRRRRSCHGSGQGLPHARASRGPPRPARLGAARRSGARARAADPEAHARS